MRNVGFTGAQRGESLGSGCHWCHQDLNSKIFRSYVVSCLSSLFSLNFALLCLSLLKIKEIVHSEIVFSVHIPFQFVLWLALELSDEHIRVEPFQ